MSRASIALSSLLLAAGCLGPVHPPEIPDADESTGGEDASPPERPTGPSAGPEAGTTASPDGSSISSADRAPLPPLPPRDAGTGEVSSAPSSLFGFENAAPDW